MKRIAVLRRAPMVAASLLVLQLGTAVAMDTPAPTAPAPSAQPNRLNGEPPAPVYYEQNPRVVGTRFMHEPTVGPTYHDEYGMTYQEPFGLVTALSAESNWFASEPGMPTAHWWASAGGVGTGQGDSAPAAQSSRFYGEPPR